MLRLFKVRGDSLFPNYCEGDFVIAVKIPFVGLHPHSGEVVVFRHPELGILIKQVDHLSPDGQSAYVIGTHPHSIDSRTFGFVPLRDIVGKVVWKIARK